MSLELSAGINGKLQVNQSHPREKDREIGGRRRMIRGVKIRGVCTYEF